MKNDNTDRIPEDDGVRSSRFGVGRLLIALALVWLGISAVTWVLDLAHRVFVLVALGIAVFAVARVARKS